jgi:hypothetical protein
MMMMLLVLHLLVLQLLALLLVLQPPTLTDSRVPAGDRFGEIKPRLGVCVCVYAYLSVCTSNALLVYPL